MNTPTTLRAATPAAQGCGSSGCQCASGKAGSANASPDVTVAYINGIALHAPGQQPDVAMLRELAYTELLRQQAARLGLLPRHIGPDALNLSLIHI